MVEYSASVFRNLNLTFTTVQTSNELYAWLYYLSLMFFFLELCLFESAGGAFLYINYHIQC